MPYSDGTCHSLFTSEKSDVRINQIFVSWRISDLYINSRFLPFFKIFFKAWGNAARLFFNFRDVKLLFI